MIKQSGATMICVFTGMAAAAAPAVVAGITQSEWVLSGTALALIALTFWMWRSLVKTGDERLYKLS